MVSNLFTLSQEVTKAKSELRSNCTFLFLSDMVPIMGSYNTIQKRDFYTNNIMRYELINTRRGSIRDGLVHCPKAHSFLGTNWNLEALLLILNPVLTVNLSLLLDKSFNQSSSLKYVPIYKLEEENTIFKDLAILLGEE